MLNIGNDSVIGNSYTPCRLAPARTHPLPFALASESRWLFRRALVEDAPVPLSRLLPKLDSPGVKAMRASKRKLAAAFETSAASQTGTLHATRTRLLHIGHNELRPERDGS